MLPQAVLALTPPLLLRRVSLPRDISALSAPRQLLVDVSVIARRDTGTGIHRVVRALLDQLRAAPPKGFVVRPVAATRRRGYRYADYPESVTTDRVGDEPVSVGPGDIFLVLDLTANVLPRHLFQIMAWKRAGVSVHFFVYDLLPLFHPAWFSTRLVRNFGRWIRTLAAFADGVICISRVVEADVAAWLSRHARAVRPMINIGTIPLGSDIGASVPTRGIPAEARADLEQLRGRRAVLMVGTVEPRKGHALALAAFEHLWATGWDGSLVIVGQPGWKTEALQHHIRTHPELHRRLFWFSSASDELLERLYETVTGLLAASLAEGYGLPLIEAGRQGIPVLARDIPVFREVAGASTTFFRGDTAAALAEQLSAWLDSACAAASGLDEGGVADPVTWADSAAALRHWLVTAGCSDGKTEPPEVAAQPGRRLWGQTSAATRPAKRNDGGWETS